MSETLTIAGAGQAVGRALGEQCAGELARAQIVATARTWLGVPFQHQGRSRAGVDCAGLLMAVAAERGLPVLEVTNYGRMPNPRRMGEELARQMDRIAVGQAGPGDALWLAWREQPQHLAIVTELGIVHAYESIGRVVEQPLDQTWRGRVRGAFRFRTG